MDPESLRVAGWQMAEVGGFTAQLGPLWMRGEGRERVIGMIVEERHTNTHLGTVHGGVVMTFADIGLGAGVDAAIEGASSATASIQTHFISAARVGDFMTCKPEVIRRSKRLVFVRGLITVDGKTVASVDGIWKILESRD